MKSIIKILVVLLYWFAGYACASTDFSKLPENLRLPAEVTLASITADGSALDKIARDDLIARDRPAYQLVAGAVLERMRGSFDRADQLALKCLAKAKSSSDAYAEMQCGMLRLSTARMRLDLAQMAVRAKDVQESEGVVNRELGRTSDAVNRDPDASYDRSVDFYDSLKGLPSAVLDRASARDPAEVPFSYKRNKLSEFDDMPHLAIVAGGKKLEAVLDSGAYFSMIPKSLASGIRMHLTDFYEPVSDLSGITTLHRTAIVDTLAVGQIVIHNFPILIENDETTTVSQANRLQTPIIGDDLLIFLKRYKISRRGLTLFPKVDEKCTDPVLVSAEIDPTIATVFGVAHCSCPRNPGHSDTVRLMRPQRA